MRKIGNTVYPDRIIHEFCDLEQCDRAAKQACNRTCPHLVVEREARKPRNKMEVK